MGFDPTKVPAKDAVVKIGKLNEEAAVGALEKEQGKGGGPRKSVLQALKDRLEFFRQRDAAVIPDGATISGSINAAPGTFSGKVPERRRDFVKEGIVDAPPSRFALYRDGKGIQHRCEVVRSEGSLAVLKIPALEPGETQEVTVHQGDAPGEFRWK